MVGAASGIADACGDAAPFCSVPFARSRERMSDFVQNYLLHIVIACLVAEMPRQRDAFGPVVTLTKPGGGAIPLESPLGEQSMGCQDGFRPILNPFQFRHRSRLVRGEPRGSWLSPPQEKTKSWVDK